jgi:hypothetical protein
MKKLFTILSLTLLTILQANAQGTFQSIATGVYNATTTWSLISGTDVDGKPDADDDVFIMAGHIVKLPSSGTSLAKNLTINVGGILNGISKVITVSGNLTQNGAITNGLYLQIAAGKSCVLSTPSTTYSPKGSILCLTNSTLTIASGSTVKFQGHITMQAGAKVINSGIVNLLYLSASLNGAIKATGANSNWTNNGASSLTTYSSNATNAASASMSVTGVGSVVNFNSNSRDLIPGDYYDLNINSNNAKSLAGNISILNTFNLATGTASTLNLNGKTLAFGGDAVVNSPIIGSLSGSNILFNGTSGATQSITGSKSITTYSMEVNTPSGGVLLNTTQQNRVFNTLTLTDGNFNANSKLTLVSNASETARIAPVTGGSFTGNIVMEKFFSGSNAKWFDMSSPSVGSVVMDWDDEIYISGIGSYDGIGGPKGVDGDVVSTTNPTFNYVKSMNTYDESTASYVGVVGSNTPLVPGIGYDLWFEDLTNDFWDAKTINTIGIPNTGDITLNLSNSGPSPYDGYHLIGNPYASAIDLSLIIDFSQTYYTNLDEFDVEVLDGTASGNFSLIDAITPGAIIYPHQGFWVRALGGGGSFTFNEACKVSDVTTAVNQRQAANYDIKLMLTSGSTNFYHENFVNFNNLATVNFERQYDAGFRYSPIKDAPALFMLDASGKKMTKNSIDNVADEVSIPLGIFTPKSAVYNVEASVLNMDSYNYSWIENVRTGKLFDLNSNSIIIEGEEGKTNTDYVLHLSKTKKPSTISSTLLESDLVIFNTENLVNLKSETSDHNLSEINIYDMTGKLILSEKNVTVHRGSVTKIDVSSLSNGIYIVNAIDNNGKSITKKVVK